MHGPGCLEILGRSSVRRVSRGKAKSFGRNSMAGDIEVACGPRKGRPQKATEYFWILRRSRQVSSPPSLIRSSPPASAASACSGVAEG